jgi:hypothetical protein
MKVYEILSESSFDPDVLSLQKELKDAGANLGPFGPKHDGLDGLMGPYTRRAADKFPEIAKKYKDTMSLPDAPMAGQMSSGGPIVGAQKSSKYMVDPKEMASYLKGEGLDKNSIAGLLANAQAESGFNAGVYVANDVNGPGGGLFGFHDTFDGRVHNFTDMVNACGGESKWQENWKRQLDFALKASGYPKQGFDSPGAATAWFVKHYERPANASYQIAVRSRAADNFA